MSSGAAKRIRKAVDILMQLSPEVWITNPITQRRETHTLSFITLTIPEQEYKPQATEGHKLLLAPWLLCMKRKYGLSVYIWKAEFQKNGMLHYHITTRSWIAYYHIRDEWNYLLNKNGLLENHKIKFDSRYPNGTDVHKVRMDDLLEMYLQKEISKAIQNNKTKGKIWDCSKAIKDLNYFTALEPSDMPQFNTSLDIRRTDHCTILKHTNPSQLLPKQLQAQYKQWIKENKFPCNIS